MGLLPSEGQVGGCLPPSSQVPGYLSCPSVLLFISVMRRPNPQVSLRRPLPLVGPASRVCPALLSLHMFVPAGPLPAVPPTPLSCLHSVLFGDA